MSSCSTRGAKRRNFKDAGRVCPVDYRLDEHLFAADPACSCDTLFVVGGLYGNPYALDAVDRLASAESGDVLVVLNGDVHWFDKTAENFEAIERKASRHTLLVGNVEAELRRETDIGVGCGCSYPECTPDDDVSRSNRIHNMLSTALFHRPDLRELLQGRLPALNVSVGGRKVGITHGDEKLIGGWGCSRESLQDPIRQDELSRWLRKTGIEVFATTHTCSPAAMVLADGIVINNGAAGLPNFSGQDFGIVTRISITPAQEAVFGTRTGDLFVDAVPLRYDQDAYVSWFDDLWSDTSPASISYRERIVAGPDDYIEDALLGGFSVDAAYRKKAARPREQATEHDVELALARLMYFEDLLDESHLVTEPHLDILQANIGKLCNLACAHCHVEAGPARTELMDRRCMEAILDVMEAHGIETLDITGGAPEMNPDFAWFIGEAARRIGRVMVRSNLVILLEPGFEHFVDRYAELGIEVVASLPNVNAAQSEKQRGAHTFSGSLEVLRRLNERGYGAGSGLVLDLVFNPQWPLLPPEQGELERVYKRRLADDFGITFDTLFAVANNPIGRYGAHLVSTGQFDGYLDTLMDAFNPESVASMMCRHQVSVGYDGRMYDCDFNQAVGLCQQADGHDLSIFDYAADPNRPLGRSILFGNHCYACTAGFGSSCTGTLVQT
ncbi:arsenosugar biosynthesis radical SAM (seleno)protein ArsS [Raoultibacter phocaeensis]|uniref:arsenosugar biosynthesis radical SAM (seleno)protein ArsS n=1 Tax=Raoultibacter phocaeensis TaxID=2479841 RepID=UPI001C598859|nr:arsenosugar biosynthesis radical SAM (seleno)protein ArsS [Raoultibacter phocaeensis]